MYAQRSLKNALLCSAVAAVLALAANRVGAIPEQADEADDVYPLLALMAPMAAPPTPAPLTLVLSTQSVGGGGIVEATVNLNCQAPGPGGSVVTITSSDPTLASVPASVTVPPGRRQGAFRILTSATATTTPVLITVAAGGGSLQKTLTVAAARVATMFVSPFSLQSGAVAYGTVTLAGNAPAGGVVVLLLASAPAAVSMPSTVTVPAGTNTTRFALIANPVSAPASVAVSATVGDSTARAGIVVTPPTLSAFLLSSYSVRGGTGVTGTLRLTGPAPAGFVATLSTGGSMLVRTPSTVTFPPGSTQVTFSAGTSTVSSPLPVGITVILGVSRKSVTLRLTK